MMKIYLHIKQCVINNLGKFENCTILITCSNKTFKMYLHVPTEHFDVQRRHVIDDFSMQSDTLMPVVLHSLHKLLNQPFLFNKVTIMHCSSVDLTYMYMDNV